jgi:hypothetical protein
LTGGEIQDDAAVDYDASFFQTARESTQKPKYSKFKLNPVYFHDKRQGEEQVLPGNWDSSLV